MKTTVSPFISGIIVLLTLVIPSQGGKDCTPRPDLSSDCEITVDRVDDYSTPWSHYLFPGMGSDPFGIAIFNQLSQTDGQCLAVYDDTFMPPLRWVDSIVSLRFLRKNVFFIRTIQWPTNRFITLLADIVIEN